MDNTCSMCGHEAEDGEMFTLLVNPNGEWWLELFTIPRYCDSCLKEIKSPKAK